jgi:WhiB family redox-sensing transcriptional regulator
LNWRIEANCSNADAELFFADRTTDSRAVRVAKAICSGCVVSDECLKDALESKSLGIWAGTDEFERARMLKKEIYRKKDLFDIHEYKVMTKGLGVK